MVTDDFFKRPETIARVNGDYAIVTLTRQTSDKYMVEVSVTSGDVREFFCLYLDTLEEAWDSMWFYGFTTAEDMEAWNEFYKV
jgi:hypothetical protein